MDIVSAVVQFGEVLWNLKGLYDQYGDNKKDLEELLSFIHDYKKQVPSLKECFKESKANALRDAALEHLEGDIKDAIEEVGRWSRKKSFFRVFTSNQRKESITKLHTKVMASVQKALGIASVSMHMDVQASIVEMHGDLKSLMISSMKRIEGLKLLEVRGKVEKACNSTFADEKFWHDILAAVNNQRGTPLSQEDMYEDPITTNLMVDPIVATNGNTYCRWTIIDNNMTKDPHNPNVALSILVDNVQFRRGLFENFPNQVKKFHEYRNEYRSKSLQLAREGRLGDAALGLQHVLEWDIKDEECVIALKQVRETLEEAKEDCAQPLLETSNVEHDVTSSSTTNHIEGCGGLEKASDIDLMSATRLRESGEKKRLLGKYGEALEDLNKANELKPNDELILFERGVVKRLLGKYGEALEDLDKANELKPNKAFILSECGVVKRLLGKYGEALEDLDMANDLKPNDAHTLYEHGGVKKFFGKYGEALEDLNKANELKPNDELTLKERGVVKRLLGKYGEALEDLNKANELNPNKAFILYERGVVKTFLGKYGEALEDLNKANELKPNDAFVLYERGVVKKRLEKYGEALEDLNKANEHKPNDELTLKERGVVKRLLGKYGEALEDLNKANELNPNKAFILYECGVVKTLLGKYGEALEDLNKANELKPNNEYILHEQNVVKKLMGKYSGIQKLFRKFA